MKKRTLLYLLLAAVVIYFFPRLFKGSADYLFHDSLIRIDSAAVTAVSILPAADPQGEFYLKREGNTWIASQGARSVKALRQAVNETLGLLLGCLDSYQLASPEKKDWDRYGVGPQQGFRVRIYEKGALLGDFIVGKVEMGPDSLPHSFVRLWEDEEVYSAPGDLSGIWPGFDHFRSMALLDLDPAKVKELQWEPAGMDTAFIFADSLQAYLEGVKSLLASTFADDFDPVSMSGSLLGRLIFSGSEWERPVEVRVYHDTLWEKPFIFYSTQNPDNYFSSDSSEIFPLLLAPVYSLPRDSISQ
ncbi:MAG: hypothetical protein WA004_14805 [Saprospiraceae bacterium]